MNSFANLLKQHINRIGASSYWLGNRIGVSSQTINNWRNSKSMPHKKDGVVQCAHYLRLDEQETNAFLKAAGFGEAFLELHEQIYSDYLKDLFKRLKNLHQPVMLLLTQAGWGEPPCRKALLAKAEHIYGANNVLHLQPPYSLEEDTNSYFKHLGMQCGFDNVEDAADFEYELKSRLEESPIFLMVSRLEQGETEQREKLAGILRNICEIYDDRRLHVILAGGEKLASLKYEQGSMSLLNIAKEEHWHELTLKDASILFQYENPETTINDNILKQLLDISGGHPQLLKQCFSLYRKQPTLPLTDYPNFLAKADILYQSFVPFLQDSTQQQRLHSLLAENEVALAEPFILDNLIRKLYWQNLLASSSNKTLQWRSESIKIAGLQILNA